MDAIKSYNEYQEILKKVDDIIKKADTLGGFENLPTDEIQALGEYGRMSRDYERNILKLMPIVGKNPIVVRLEAEMQERSIKQKELAKLLDISEPRLSDVINGKASISLSLAKKLHTILGIDGNLILENV